MRKNDNTKFLRLFHFASIRTFQPKFISRCRWRFEFKCAIVHVVIFGVDNISISSWMIYKLNSINALVHKKKNVKIDLDRMEAIEKWNINSDIRIWSLRILRNWYEVGVGMNYNVDDHSKYGIMHTHWQTHTDINLLNRINILRNYAESKRKKTHKKAFSWHRERDPNKYHTRNEREVEWKKLTLIHTVTHSPRFSAMNPIDSNCELIFFRCFCVHVCQETIVRLYTTHKHSIFVFFLQILFVCRRFVCGLRQHGPS